MSLSKSELRPTLIIRSATAADIPAIRKLCRKVYANIDDYTYTQDQLRGQMASFPEGQFVATFEDALVGYCATFQIDEAIAFAPHSWSGITGNGFAARHDPEGDWLYGMEVFVDSDYRGHRIGQRLYEARKALATEMRLKGVTFGGRIPSLARRWMAFGSAEAYIQAVNEKKVRDSVLSFQMRNGFEVVGVLKDYWPEDKASMGYAVHLAWRNPKYVEVSPIPGRQRGRIADTVRIGVIQYQQRRVSSFEEFSQQVEYFRAVYPAIALH